MLDFLSPVINLNLIASIIAFIFGIAILWLSSEIILKKINPIARFFGVKELVVTILGVSVLSSLPELLISLISNTQGNSNIAFGNIVGSNFVTLTFVTAVCAVISPIPVKKEAREREAVWMILSSVIILLLAIDRSLSRIDGFILMLFYIPYLISVIRDSKDKHNKSQTDNLQQNKNERGKISIHILVMLAAVAGVIAGADIALMGGQNIGVLLNIPPLALGIILFAFGTSLPEFAIALSATLKKKADIVISEIYASNIFTALFVLGLCCIVMPMNHLDERIINFDLPFLILSGIIVQIFITTNQKLIRMEAIVILALYCYFVLGHFLDLSFSF